MSKLVILSDMDGVKTNFIDAALKANNCSKLHDEVDQWDIAKCMNVTPHELWQNIEAVKGFWENLEPYPWIGEYRLLLRKHELHVCTSPTSDPACAYGKHIWLKRHFGIRFRRFVITPQKHLLAKPNHVLIDDSDDNIKKFREHGGKGILFPQPWNGNRDQLDDRIEYVKEQMSILQEE